MIIMKKLTHEGSEDISSSEKSSCVSVIAQPDYSWMEKLLKLQKKALNYQYQLAYLATLGGAYHLCNHPKEALALAYRQELIGLQLGSTSIIVRAKIYQFTNLSLLGCKKKSNRVLREAKRVAAIFNIELVELCNSAEKWVLAKHSEANSDKAARTLREL
mmetsp:Transcript_21676/g.31544  ORF Transcript_21676/g.31544 Transcript_21676/m.31544 type:complete len:160 (-) Transcript_21676:51-530(-)